MPQIMDADILQTGARSDTLPEWLEVREPRTRFRTHDGPGVHPNFTYPETGVKVGLCLRHVLTNEMLTISISQIYLLVVRASKIIRYSAFFLVAKRYARPKYLFTTDLFNAKTI